jgi:hypothetical protein
MFFSNVLYVFCGICIYGSVRLIVFVFCVNKKHQPTQKKNQSQSQAVQESPRRQPASQSATKPAAPAVLAGQPICQPAGAWSSQAQILRPKRTLSLSGVAPNSVAPASMSPKSEQSPEKKLSPSSNTNKKWFQSQGVQESPSSQPASQSDKQQAALASRPASQPARTQSRQAQIPVRKWTLHGSKCGPSEHLLQTPLRAHPRKIIITMSISRKKNEPSPETKVRSQSRAVQQSPKGPPVSHAASRCGRPASLPDCQPGPRAARFKSWAQNGV